MVRHTIFLTSLHMVASIFRTWLQRPERIEREFGDKNEGGV